MSAFRKGQKVKLKSGGPLMTVDDVGDFSGMGLGPENGVRCIWFAKDELKQQVFDEETLEVA